MARSRLAVVLALAVAAAAAWPGIVEAEEVNATCDTPSHRDGCERWYTAASVILDWTWTPGAAMISGCEGATFTSEARVERTCRVDWSNTTITKKVWIGIDRTPPQILAPQTSRPPDHNGWFNHPLSLTFQGSDKTSGVASCSSTSYGGPDGQGVPVAGSCSDVAGNVGSTSFPLNYDATVPAPPRVAATPGNRRVALRWSIASEIETVAVVRFTSGSPPATVFRGRTDRYMDTGLTNRKAYRYRVFASDAAGNSAVDRVRAVPTASKLLKPPLGARLRNAPLLVWKRVRRAAYYNVQLVRGRKVLSDWPRINRLQLKHRWRYGGAQQRLVPGRYCWYVWPGFGPRSKRDYGRRLGKSCFTVVR